VPNIKSVRAFMAAGGIGACTVLVPVLTLGGPLAPTLSAQSDLDAFMQQVVARRDDNWKKLQQYVLDERDVLELRGPGNSRLWGEERDYTWFIRDGFFIRSPLKFNGVTIGEDERRKEEDEYLRRTRRRDERAADRDAKEASAGAGAPRPADPVQPIAGGAADGGSDSITNVDGLIRQTRQPQFISSVYFLRFKFDAGTYALVGRDTFEGREVLRVEYYPTRLYERASSGRRGRQNDDPESKASHQEAELRRVMNKVALVTLWIEPASHQIVKYTFDNVDFDFLPGQWIVKVDTAKASMTMGQPFKDVWLPQGIEVNVGLTLAIGEIAFRAAVTYHDYREATVTTKVGIPGTPGGPAKR
jgi:hypothetical protein